jgi:hypothetical protein
MLLACWSAKGGSGTTVVAVALAALLARRAPSGALLVDLAGDVPWALGLADGGAPGVGEWLAASPGAPPDALARIELPGAGGLRVVVRGDGPLEEEGASADVLASLLASDPRPVVADCGTDPRGAARAVARAAAASLLVVRPCSLALRLAQRSTVRATGVVLVREEGRALWRDDVEAVLGVPVIAEVPVQPAVARAVDAGTLGARIPRSLARGLRHVA